MIRLGFVSNSSSSSFVIPKKYLTDEDREVCEQFMYDVDTSIHESEHYMYGTFSMHNVCLTRVFKKYEGKEGVDYQCAD
jgi:hypothetical protein